MDAHSVSKSMPVSDAYRVLSGLFDEMFDEDRKPRPGCARVVADLMGRDPQRLAELTALFETGATADLVIPNRGVRGMKAKAVKWDTNLTAKIRSGEAVEFSFLED